MLGFLGSTAWVNQRSTVSQELADDRRAERSPLEGGQHEQRQTAHRKRGTLGPAGDSAGQA